MCSATERGGCWGKPSRCGDVSFEVGNLFVAEKPTFDIGPRGVGDLCTQDDRWRRVCSRVSLSEDCSASSVAMRGFLEAMLRGPRSKSDRANLSFQIVQTWEKNWHNSGTIYFSNIKFRSINESRLVTPDGIPYVAAPQARALCSLVSAAHIRCEAATCRK